MHFGGGGALIQNDCFQNVSLRCIKAQQMKNRLLQKRLLLQGRGVNKAQLCLVFLPCRPAHIQTSLCPCLSALQDLPGGMTLHDIQQGDFLCRDRCHLHKHFDKNAEGPQGTASKCDPSVNPVGKHFLACRPELQCDTLLVCLYDTLSTIQLAPACDSSTFY